MQAVDTAVTIPGSEAEAAEAFGDGAGVTVIAGATMLQPLLTRGQLRPERALLLHAAGMGGVAADGDTLTIGATATLAKIAAAAPEPLASAARIPDAEIRAQATLGGNLHVAGDLHAPLIAMGATVRSTGAGGERSEPIEAFLAGDERRLVLDVSCARPRAGAFLAQRRLHAASYTVVSVAVADTGDGIAVAAGGVGDHGVRCASVERALAGGVETAAAAEAVRDDVEGHDDPLGPGWYRVRVLPVLITRALSSLR